MYKKTLKSVSKNALKAASKKKSKALKYGNGRRFGFLSNKKQQNNEDSESEIPTSTTLQNLENRVTQLELSEIPHTLNNRQNLQNENIRLLNKTQQTLSDELEKLSGELEQIRTDLKLYRHDLKYIEKRLNNE